MFYDNFYKTLSLYILRTFAVLSSVSPNPNDALAPGPAAATPFSLYQALVFTSQPEPLKFGSLSTRRRLVTLDLVVSLGVVVSVLVSRATSMLPLGTALRQTHKTEEPRWYVIFTEKANTTKSLATILRR